MAWSAPRTWVTGELVTAAIGNAHWRDNQLETAPAKVTTAGDIVVASGANAIKRLAMGAALSVPRVNTVGTDLEYSSLADKADASALTGHQNATGVHGATAAATADRIIIRDAAGRAKVVAPSAGDDIARLDTVTAHSSRTDNPHATSAAQVGAIPTAEKGAASGVAELDANSRVPRSITGTAASLWDSGTAGAANPILVRINGGNLEYSNNGGSTWNQTGVPEAKVFFYGLMGV